MNNTKTIDDIRLYLRLLPYLRKHWKPFSLAVLGMVCIAATEPVFPAIMKYLLDNGFKTSEPKLIWLIPIGIILLFFIRGILTFCTAYLMTWVSTKVITELQKDMFAHMLKLPTQIYHDFSAGKLISRVISDSSSVAGSITNLLVTSVREALTALSLFGYLLYLDWKLTLVSFAISPVITWIIIGFGKKMRMASRGAIETGRNLIHCVEEASAANKVIKIYGGQNALKARFQRNVEQFRRAQMREAVPSSAITPVTHLAASVMVAGIVFLALSQVTGGASVSAGGFISFITALLMLISPIKQLTSLSTSWQRGLVSCESVFEFLDLPPENDSGQKQIAHAQGKITFKHVRFSYPGSDQITLSDINFQVLPGQTIALVGASGGGKTTISALLTRFYSPTQGQIFIDDIDIQQLSLSSLRDNMALVSQDIVLFNDSVEANIAFGARGSCSREDIIAAAEAANAWQFIQQLPQGLETTIGEDGAKLSGGQRQRIAIARALLKDAPILILDEATSALDSESERQVQSALATLMKNRTTLIIAHRLSTIEHADQIIAIDQGRVIEAGTHQELITKGGYYATLNRIQA